MAKSKKQKRLKRQTVVLDVQKESFLEKLEHLKFIFVFFVLLYFLLVILYKPMVIQGFEPSGSDIISGIGKTHQLKMWEGKTGHYPLWNPYMFGGMPVYHRIGPRIWSIDTLLNNLDFLGDWRLWYFLAGALGIFLLVKFFRLPSVAGMLAALSFVLMPHFQALIIVGHFAKFRALMWMPYVLLTALLLFRKQNLFSALLFSLALALQFRTQHYQILFYTLLSILFFGVAIFIRMIRCKQWASIGKCVLLSVIATSLAVLVVSQNLLSIKEYTPYSTRGGHAISIKNTSVSEQEKKGVGFDYATNWSYSISEFWNLIIPKFHGGTSNERYTGNAVPEFKNRTLPTYWGDMPFTQSYEYLGILIVFLAIVGVIFNWKRWEVKSLTFLTILALLMALGKNFSTLYKLFFYYVPYFDKFRVPMMILTLVMLTVSLLAAFGCSTLLNMSFEKKEQLKKLYIISGIFGAILIIPLLFGSSFSLMQTGEAQRYGQEVVVRLRKVRLELLQKSTFTSLFFYLLGLGGIFLVGKNWLKKELLPVIMILIVAIDLILLDAHYVEGKFINSKMAEQQQYRLLNIDREIQKDKDLFRIFPVGRLFQDTRWSYYYQSIGGYSPAKMQTIQEIIENNLYVQIESPLPINWNVVDMLNVKYLIAQQELNSPRLKLIESDQRYKLFAYENLNFIPRANFVGRYQVISDGIQRLQYLNSAEFNPRKMAILEKELSQKIETPDSTNIKIDFQPEKVVLDVYTDKQSLLVLSEMYYPPGWKAFIDGGKEIEIYKTNHLLRSVVVPKGNHKIEFIFHPASYYAGLRISFVSLLILYGMILFFLFREYGSKMYGMFKFRSINRA